MSSSIITFQESLVFIMALVQTVNDFDNLLVQVIDETVKYCLGDANASYPMLDNAVTSLNQGADAFLTKPVDPSKVLENIKDKIEKQKAAEVATEANITVFLKNKAEKLLAELK